MGGTLGNVVEQETIIMHERGSSSSNEAKVKAPGTLPNLLL